MDRALINIHKRLRLKVDNSDFSMKPVEPVIVTPYTFECKQLKFMIGSPYEQYS